MKACALITCVLAVTLGADGGLLKVPRVYNALITSNEPLLPSRADSVSSPVVLLPSPYVALDAAPLAVATEQQLAANSSDPEPTTAAPEEAPAGSTPQPSPDPKSPPALSVAYGSGVPFPLAFYNHLGYSPFSYYPSFLAYSYPLVTPTVGLQFALPHVEGAAPPAIASSESDVKNNKPEDSVVPDVSPPPPPRGAALADDKQPEAA